MRDLERKLRTDLARTILELETPPPEQACTRRAELSRCSIDDLRALIQHLRGKRVGSRGEGTAPDIVVRAMLASKEEWLTMREIADQARALGHSLETERVSTALANLEFASGRGHGVHDGYGVEVVRKRRPYLYRLVKRATESDPVPQKCHGRNHAEHVRDVCEGQCCTSCGGPIDENEECRCG